MFHMDQNYVAAELAYRKERLTGHRYGERVHYMRTTRRGLLGHFREPLAARRSVLGGW